MEVETHKEDKVNETKNNQDLKSDEGLRKTETELDKYWQAVRDNPTDFTGWTYLLQYVEQEDQIEAAREAYDAFFSHYPYCYGYWKKYADMEKRHSNLEKSIEVFERGLKAIPLSVDLWLHYMNFYTSEYGGTEQALADIRRLYERAIAAAGTDFRSDKLWDSYITWEGEQENLVKVTGLYDRLLNIPIQLYSHHFDTFKRHVFKHHPKEILTLDEFLKLRKEVVKKSKSPSTVEDGGDEDGSSGEDVPPGMETEGGVCDSEEVKLLREKIIETREVVFKQNEEEISKRWAFEEGIKRPYFHVKPLERSQLKNWRDYLDFEIQNGTHERVVVLFERCMIACALYEDFWLKYAKYMEDHSLEAVRNVYKRACTIHLQKKPYIHMAWAAFEERQGKYDAAWEILANLDKTVKDCVMVAMRRISLERRMGNPTDTENLFQEYVENSKDNHTRAFFSLKFARYLFKIMGNPEKARQVLNVAIDKDPKNERLYIQLLDLEYQCQPVSVLRALEVFNRMINSENFSPQTKIKMSQRRLEFLEDFGTNIMELKDCYDEHQKLIKDYHSERKRKNAETSSTESGPTEKRRKSDVSHNGSGDSTPTDHSSSYSAYWSQYPSGTYNYPPQHWPHYSSSYYP
ncbi:hypothetical protein CHS0354_020419 [Potamilus streckersoni]|uniref:Pre-mRNA-processing factor 39 n=1 Tax=Potamilus streckersoni TaxID=2493646 RepID=A0AAE0SVF1_9BIVA|nr:hypothetical protein CHS0354_020419 [Potamilus streckersoni]